MKCIKMCGKQAQKYSNYCRNCWKKMEGEGFTCNVNPCQHRSPPAIGGDSYYKKENKKLKKQQKTIKTMHNIRFLLFKITLY